MRLRRMLGCALALAAVATPSSVAEAVCAPFVTDTRGDAPPSLDVVTAGLSVTRRSVVATLALSGDAGANALAARGNEWVFTVRNGDVDYVFSNRRIGTAPADTPGVALARHRPKFTFRVRDASFIWTVERAHVPAAALRMAPVLRATVVTRAAGVALDRAEGETAPYCVVSK